MVQGQRRMNFSLHVYVTGQEAGRANKDDDRPGAPAAAQEEGRPRPLRLNDRPSGRGEIAGIGYETGRPNLPRLCQAFFPSDTEVQFWGACRCGCQLPQARRMCDFAFV